MNLSPLQTRELFSPSFIIDIDNRTGEYCVMSSNGYAHSYFMTSRLIFVFYLIKKGVKFKSQETNIIKEDHKNYCYIFSSLLPFLY